MSAEAKHGASATRDLPATLRARAPWILGAGLVGLLLGWWLLGWTLFPPSWTDAWPVDLRAEEQEAYVQMVADRVAAQPDMDPVAREAWIADRLRSFRLEGDEALAEVLWRLTADDRDPEEAERARQLAREVGVAPAPPAAAAMSEEDAAAADAPAAETGAESGVESGAVDGAEDAGMPRALVALGILGFAALAGVLLWRYRGDQARDEADDETLTDRAERDAPADRPAALDPASQAYADRPPGFAPLPRPDGRTEALDLPPSLQRAPQGSAPAWRPARIDLGASATVVFDARDEGFFQTWLVYDERAGLVASAGIKAQPVGSVTTLDLWFFERDEDGEEIARPTVTIVSRAAGREPVLRARLEDRPMLSAERGARHVLLAGGLALDVEVLEVEPPPEDEELDLRGLRLGIAPRRHGGAAAGGDDEPVVGPGTSDDEAGEPPVPLPFRRD